MHIKSCPFCGAPSKLEVYLQPNDSYRPFISTKVVCSGCHCSTDGFCFEDDIIQQNPDGALSIIRKAIDTWNRRNSTLPSDSSDSIHLATDDIKPYSIL